VERVIVLTLLSDVQISTGVSQWDLPTTAAPIGGGSHSGTPAQSTNPYDTPAHVSEGPNAGDGTRGVDGPTGDRAGGIGVRPAFSLQKGCTNHVIRVLLSTSLWAAENKVEDMEAAQEVAASLVSS
jgi:hypothetical protein